MTKDTFEVESLDMERLERDSRRGNVRQASQSAKLRTFKVTIEIELKAISTEEAQASAKRMAGVVPSRVVETREVVRVDRDTPKGVVIFKDRNRATQDLTTKWLALTKAEWEKEKDVLLPLVMEALEDSATQRVWVKVLKT